jgi:hypothetical protein
MACLLDASDARVSPVSPLPLCSPIAVLSS